MEIMTAQQALEKLEDYKKAAALTASEMSIPEELQNKIYNAELHNACVSALNKQIRKAPRKTTIFEGTQAEKLAAKGITNYETYKCPVCNWIVADRSVLGIKISNYCEKCGQALDTDITKEQNT